MRQLASLLVTCVLLSSALAAEINLVADGSMESETGGVPATWQASGHPDHVTQALTTDVGHLGGNCLKLECTRFRPGAVSAHAMVCQVGKVAVESGKAYQVSFWAKQEGLSEYPVSVALMNTQGWAGLGLGASFLATPEWHQYEFRFIASATAHETTRLQIWYTAPGTLWLDEVVMTPTDYTFRPTFVWPSTGGRNLVPNAGFEAGPSGWGSSGDLEPSHGWPSPLNALVGEVVPGGHGGGHCLRLRLSPETVPVSYFDYYGLTRAPLRTLLAATTGFLETEPGREYTLSAFVRADREHAPVLLAIEPNGAAPIQQACEAGTDWQRLSLTMRATQRWVAVGVGLDWAKAAPTPLTVWLDDVQLEAAPASSEFAYREAVEAGLSTGREGNVFFKGEPVRLALQVRNASAAPAEVELTITDFCDAVAAVRRYTVPPNTPAFSRSVDPGLTRTGFYKARLAVNGAPVGRALRLALIARHRGTDSIFGVNHAWPWPHLERLAVAAGIGWARDWSNKWQHVQPTAGAAYDFSETDRQIDRARAFGQQVLGLLPFPSADWSSSAPETVAVGKGYPGLRERQAYAPRDEKEFAAWVSSTVRHYRNRVTWWQVFNEPLFTGYSLPAEKGYSGADYGRWVKVFAAAAKAADPQCKVLAGIGYWPDHVEKHFRGMFATGALDVIDAVDVHLYPGIASPESQEPALAGFAAMMREYGPARPVWLTEHGYYADDDPERDPLRHGGFDAPLPSERLQAAYSMRFNVILLAHGVERIFYHAGTSPGLHGDNLEGTFFKYGGEPRRIYAALAAFSELFRPGVKPLRELRWGPATKAYTFRQGEQTILAAWARRPEGETRLSWTDRRITARDLMGNALTERELVLTGEPVFLVAQGMGAAELVKAVQHGGGE